MSDSVDQITSRSPVRTISEFASAAKVTAATVFVAPTKEQERRTYVL
jgi:hypothetical protein